MRMWMLPPELLCQKHLGGEYYELYKIVGCLNLGKNLLGFYQNGFIYPPFIKERHAALVAEKIARGGHPVKPLPEFQVVEKGFINIEKNYSDLALRCLVCRARMQEAGEWPRLDVSKSQEISLLSRPMEKLLAPTVGVLKTTTLLIEKNALPPLQLNN